MGEVARDTDALEPPGEEEGEGVEEGPAKWHRVDAKGDVKGDLKGDVLGEVLGEVLGDVGVAAQGDVDGEARDVASSSVAPYRIGHTAR